VWEARLPIEYDCDYVVELNPGGPAVRVDSRLLRVRERQRLADPHRAEALRIRGTFLGVRDVLAVARNGVTVATILHRRAGRHRPPRGHAPALAAPSAAGARTARRVSTPSWPTRTVSAAAGSGSLA
jgi:hypothetical protein